jgi:hypothetical protein
MIKFKKTCQELKRSIDIQNKKDLLSADKVSDKLPPLNGYLKKDNILNL